jgi:hypothetical protein
MDQQTQPNAVAYTAPEGPAGGVVAVVIGVLIASGGAFLATRMESFGYIFIVGLPIVAGFVAGYYGWTKGAWIPAVISVAITMAFGVVIYQNLAGLFCGALTCVAVILPMTVGACVGHMLRKRHFARLRNGLPVALVLLLPISLWAEAKLTPRHAPATIETSRVLAMTPNIAWASAAFFEDTDEERSTLLRLGLPAPMGTSGRQDEVGAIVRCLYEDAHITKRMTQVDRGKVLAFDVIEQSGIEDRSIQLLRGAFHFEGMPDGRTRVTLSSTYEPLLDARLYWRPIERAVCRALHRHILDGMEKRALRGVPVVASR